MTTYLTVFLISSFLRPSLLVLRSFHHRYSRHFAPLSNNDIAGRRGFSIDCSQPRWVRSGTAVSWCARARRRRASADQLPRLRCLYPRSLSPEPASRHRGEHTGSSAFARRFSGFGARIGRPEKTWSHRSCFVEGDWTPSDRATTMRPRQIIALYENCGASGLMHRYNSGSRGNLSGRSLEPEARRIHPDALSR